MGLTPDGMAFRTDGPAGEMMDEMNSSGAILVGRRTAEHAGHWGGDCTARVSRSSCSATGRRLRPLRTFHW